MVVRVLLPLMVLFTGLLTFPLSVSAQLVQKIANPAVRSLKLEHSAGFMAPLVLRLGSDESIKINFDIMGEDHHYLRARLIHCNADWTPSRLLESEYVDGFNEASIDDYAYSVNTFHHYVNYQLTVPDGDFRPKASGNYILQVYPEDAPDDVWLQAEFYVSEDSASLDGTVSPRTDKGFNTCYQQLELTADPHRADINPYQDLEIRIIQNNSPGSTHIVAAPLRVEGSRIVYAHHPSLIFPAGNEFRRFETVRADYPGMHVDSITGEGRSRKAWLSADESRVEANYVYDSTQHGRFKVDEYNSTDPDLSADYLITRFTLDLPEYPGKEVSVEGEFNSWNADGSGRMSFDRSIGKYVAEIPLKQGSYNYRYAISDRKGHTSNAPIEGDKYETRNEYLVLLYLRQPGSRGDRLIGSTTLF